LKRVISQSFDDTDHFGYRRDHNLLSIILEQQSTRCQNDTREDSREKLEHSLLLALVADLNPGVSHELFAILDFA
jgi:hypothetical protein